MNDTVRASDGPELTTAQLTERVGVPAGTLRMWEARYGFPTPTRRPGGHRRYHDREAALVIEVLRLRELGLSLPAAIAGARGDGHRRYASIFAGLRARCPDVQPVVLARRAVLALTRAIEDEWLARAASGLILGGFQRAENLRRVQGRWRELARSAELAVALADFPRLHQTDWGLFQVPVAPAHPLAREWSIVVHARGTWGCLAAWEIPPSPEISERRFEVVWSAEPQVVHEAVRVAQGVLAELAPAVADRLGALAGPAPPQSTGELRAAAALSHRIVDYLVL